MAIAALYPSRQWSAAPGKFPPLPKPSRRNTRDVTEQSRLAQQFRELTSPRHDVEAKDHTADDNLPAANLAAVVDYSEPRPSSAGVGHFNTLPLEILHDIMFELDLQSLSSLRSVNRSARHLVDTFPHYAALAAGAPDVLAVALATGAAAHTTCQRLLAKLSSAACEDCADPLAGYLYLPTCRRVCYPCLSQGERYLPLPHKLAARQTGLKQADLAFLPGVRCVPGDYGPGMKRLDREVQLVDREAAVQAGIALHGSLVAMREHASDMRALELAAARDRAVRAGAKLSSLVLQQFEFSAAALAPLRFAAVVRAPVLGGRSALAQGQAPEWGAYCSACSSTTGSRLPARHVHPRRLYTPASFDRHLEECGRIEDGKHVLE